MEGGVPVGASVEEEDCIDTEHRNIWSVNLYYVPSVKHLIDDRRVDTNSRIDVHIPPFTRRQRHILPDKPLLPRLKPAKGHWRQSTYFEWSFIQRSTTLGIGHAEDSDLG